MVEDVDNEDDYKSRLVQTPRIDINKLQKKIKEQH
jgi:hypothetical protein